MNSDYVRKGVPYFDALLFSASAVAFGWLFWNYASLTSLISVPLFVLAAFVIVAFGVSVLNAAKRDKLLRGASCDVLSLTTQKVIRKVALTVMVLGLAYSGVFTAAVLKYDQSAEAYTNILAIQSFEQSLFGKSTIMNYIPKIPQYTDFGPYMMALEKKIKTNWHPAKQNESNRVKVRFKVDPDGSYRDLQIHESSGIEQSDQAALQAIRDCGSFAKLPVGAGKDVDIEFTFDYNVWSSEATDTFSSNSSSSDAFSTSAPLTDDSSDGVATGSAYEFVTLPQLTGSSNAK